MTEILVVGLYNTPDRNDEYTYVYDPSEMMGGKGNQYLDFIEKVTIVVDVGAFFMVPIGCCALDRENTACIDCSVETQTFGNVGFFVGRINYMV